MPAEGLSGCSVQRVGKQVETLGVQGTVIMHTSVNTDATVAVGHEVTPGYAARVRCWKGVCLAAGGVGGQGGLSGGRGTG